MAYLYFHLMCVISYAGSSLVPYAFARLQSLV